MTIDLALVFIDLLGGLGIQHCAQGQELSQLQNEGSDRRNLRFLVELMLVIPKETADSPQLLFPGFIVPSSGFQKKMKFHAVDSHIYMNISQ